MKEYFNIPVYQTNDDEQNYFYNFQNAWLSSFVEKILLKKLYEYYENLLNINKKDNNVSISQKEAVNNLVEYTWNIFESNGGKVCGGFFSTLFSNNKSTTKTDIDIFFNPDSSTQLERLENIINCYTKNNKNCYKKTKNAYSLFINKMFNSNLYNYNKFTFRISYIQLVLPEICSGYNIIDIIKTFDFTICQFGYDIKNKIFTQAKCFDSHIQQNRLYISPFFNGTICKKRLDKYINIKKFCIK